MEKPIRIGEKVQRGLPRREKCRMPAVNPCRYPCKEQMEKEKGGKVKRNKKGLRKNGRVRKHRKHQRHTMWERRKPPACAPENSQCFHSGIVCPSGSTQAHGGCAYQAPGEVRGDRCAPCLGCTQGVKVDGACTGSGMDIVQQDNGLPSNGQPGSTGEGTWE